MSEPAGDKTRVTLSPYSALTDHELLVYLADNMAWLTNTVQGLINSAPKFMRLGTIRKDSQ